MSDNIFLPTLRFGSFLALVGVIFFSMPVQAAEGPVTNLEKALKSGKKQILFAGKENDDVTIKSGVAVTGTSPDKASINGDIKMENGSSLSNVTVSGKKIPITIAKGASVTLSNVTVRGGTDAGIFAPEGGGTLTIRNSRITKNRKGFYILPGKGLNISGSIINENKEEGLDARAGTSGSLVGNQFINNGEGGAEIIAGGAKLTLRNNTFAGNKSSGLAIQSYAGSGKAPGNIVLDSNTFANNRDFGLTCSSPSKGGAGAVFYKATIKAVDNTFRANGAGNISAECGGVVNRSSALETKEEPQSTQVDPRIEEEKLRDEARQHFEETIVLLHDQEYALELTLTALDQAVPWSKRIFSPVITGPTVERIVRDIATINELRSWLDVFPIEWLTEEQLVEQKMVVKRSLERMEALRQYFERLQKPLIPMGR